jgi:hypothetical protein
MNELMNASRRAHVPRWGTRMSRSDLGKTACRRAAGGIVAAEIAGTIRDASVRRGSCRATFKAAPALQIFGRDRGQPIGDQPVAVELFKKGAAQGAAILSRAARRGFEFDPAEAGVAFGADGGADVHGQHYASSRRRFEDTSFSGFARR